MWKVPRCWRGEVVIYLGRNRREVAFGMSKVYRPSCQISRFRAGCKLLRDESRPAGNITPPTTPRQVLASLNPTSPPSLSPTLWLTHLVLIRISRIFKYGDGLSALHTTTTRKSRFASLWPCLQARLLKLSPKALHSWP
jgi:hypothetical protein